MYEELDEIFDSHLTVSELSTQQEKYFSSDISISSDQHQTPKYKGAPNRKRICSPDRIETIKRNYDTNLAKIKEEHIEKEQVIKKANELKYKNLVWEITTKHFNKGIYENDLLPLFRMSLAKHEMNLRKEISILQSQQREELRELKNKELLKEQHKQKLIYDPLKIAKAIYQNIFIKFDAKKEENIDGILDDILDKLEDDRRIIFSPRPRSPALRKFAPKSTDPSFSTSSYESDSDNHFQIRIPNEPKLRPEAAARVRRHNRNREKLEKELNKTNEILQKMKDEAVNDVFFPQLSPLLH